MHPRKKRVHFAIQKILCAALKSQQEVSYLEYPIGANILRLRRSHDMTQRQLAHALRVTVQAVSKWEGEKGYPDLTLLVPIANLFDVTLDELFGRADR